MTTSTETTPSDRQRILRYEWDEEQKIHAACDPQAEFATWQEHCRSIICYGWNGDELTLEDFQTYIASKPNTPEIKALRLVKAIAALRKDGEGEDGGEPWVMENDDAVSTLHHLIDQAREFTGININAL